MKKALIFLSVMFLPGAAFAAGYGQTNLVANKPKFAATKREPKLINAWGIAIRPAGAGGHFWITGKDISFEYVGDVQASPDEKLRTLHTDELAYVTLPVGGDDKFATGVVFLNSTDKFVITQTMPGVEPITAASKFIFASDGGIISAWTERKKTDGTFDRPTEAIAKIDDSKNGAQFFGLAVSAAYDKIYAADFGSNPGIKTYGPDFKPLLVKFGMPFDENKNGVVDPGEYAPFNIQRFAMPSGQSHLFVTYAKTSACPKKEIGKACKEGGLFAGEEDISNPGQGRLAEFSEDGKLVAMWKDGGKLSAPWGLAFAPSNFGELSGMLLVANFGDGTIAAYNPTTREFTGYMRDKNDKPITIDKIWGLLFGNGVSLGDSNALYFSAGPNDEQDGVFGSLRAAP